MAASQRRPLVAGNWKMNGLRQSASELLAVIAGSAALAGRVELMICPPATLVAEFAALCRSTAVLIGGQDCHAEVVGPFTGDISAEMLADAGASAVIVGHSERRSGHHESDADVCAKAKAAWRAGLAAIVCIGETRVERDAGQTLDVLGRQVDSSIPEGASGGNLIVAYEPVWAIGSGLTPTGSDVAQAHRFIRDRLQARHSEAAASAIRIPSGGSVKPSNARELMSVPNVDGALVGGASLKADEFLAIVGAYS
jgi:triosephosphate isomerase